MRERPPILCIGAALWDVIARTPAPLAPGADVPGRIERRLGGVALNVALALADLGAPVVLLGAVGRDGDGEHLIAELTSRGVDCTHIARYDGRTDAYLAIEDGAGELFAAVADCAGLERVGEAVLAPLRDGRLAGSGAPWRGRIVVDGNLPETVLAALAAGRETAPAGLAVVPASPGKAARLGAILAAPRVTLYLNRREAEVICGAVLPSSRAAAEALLARGIAEAVVTDGAAAATFANRDVTLTAAPPGVAAHSVTGAGDRFLAAHLAAGLRGLDPAAALHAALAAAADHISRAAS